jgi:hypothetical protein
MVPMQRGGHWKKEKKIQKVCLLLASLRHLDLRRSANDADKAAISIPVSRRCPEVSDLPGQRAAFSAQAQGLKDA